MTAESADKVAEVMLRQNAKASVFEVNFTDANTCQSMMDAFTKLGCQAELLDEAWCLVRVTRPNTTTH